MAIRNHTVPNIKSMEENGRVVYVVANGLNPMSPHTNIIKANDMFVNPNLNSRIVNLI